MPYICYTPKNFRADTLALIASAKDIVGEYQEQGWNLTLRQLYYQFVARGLVPNTEKSYNKIGTVVSDARLAGMLDWYSIEDRTRNPTANQHWRNPREILEAVTASYAIDVRQDQPVYVEVWIEKDALIDIVNRACTALDVGRFSCRGYVSQSAMWRAAQRIKNRTDNRRGVVLHLGDHDPSGIDMTRDIQDRLDLFEADCEVRRIALTMPQVEEVNPPPNPTKISDSRSGEYLDNYGEECWELDALDPAYLTELITDQVDSLTDHDRLAAMKARQQAELDQLTGLVDYLED